MLTGHLPLAKYNTRAAVILSTAFRVSQLPQLVLFSLISFILTAVIVVQHNKDNA